MYVIFLVLNLCVLFRNENLKTISSPLPLLVQEYNKNKGNLLGPLSADSGNEVLYCNLHQNIFHSSLWLIYVSLLPYAINFRLLFALAVCSCFARDNSTNS